MNTFPKENKHFLLTGPSGKLEIMTVWPKKLSRHIVAIICHPHPLQEGTMNNKVVTTLAKAFDYLGMPTVRFNFRGVGQSEGEYGHTMGEIEDLQRIYHWVKKVLPTYEIILSGFSFGSYIAAKVANQQKVLQLLTVAPPVNHNDFTTLNAIQCPWLIIQGDQDEVVPIAQVKTFAETPPVPLKLIIMASVGHFFHGHLIKLRDMVQQEVIKNLPTTLI